MSGPAALARADAVIRMSQAPPKPVKRSLKVIPAPAPGTDALVSAPPVLETSGHAMEYVCGSCATPLIHANENQIHGLIIRCTRSGPGACPVSSRDPQFRVPDLPLKIIWLLGLA